MADKASVAEPTETRAKAEANFKKEERARDGAQAMVEYLASGREVRENMAKLKALRLAKEAADKEAADSKAAKPTVKAKSTRALKRTQQ